MKYYSVGILFIISSLILILFSFYYSKLTREIEKNINIIQLKISTIEDKIKVNELEFAAHTNSEYLKKLEKIYLHIDHNKRQDVKIIGINDLNFKDLGKIVKVINK